MNKEGLLIVVSGFAGTGKGTLMKQLLAKYDDYVLSVSATTRNPRPGEEEGVHYFFKTKEEFEQLILEGGLLEHACYVGNYYGTPKRFVENQLLAGKNVILEIEIQGALNIKKIFPKALLLFVLPPSGEELKNRLKGRGTETDEVIMQRISRACEEAEGIEEYDYVIVNDDIERATIQINDIVKAAAFSPKRKKDFIDKLKTELNIVAGK